MEWIVIPAYILQRMIPASVQVQFERVLWLTRRDRLVQPDAALRESRDSAWTRLLRTALVPCPVTSPAPAFRDSSLLRSCVLNSIGPNQRLQSFSTCPVFVSLSGHAARTSPSHEYFLTGVSQAGLDWTSQSRFRPEFALFDRAHVLFVGGEFPSKRQILALRDSQRLL